jgi:hypothetical protein
MREAPLVRFDRFPCSLEGESEQDYNRLRKAAELELIEVRQGVKSAGATFSSVSVCSNQTHPWTGRAHKIQMRKGPMKAAQEKTRE